MTIIKSTVGEVLIAAQEYANRDFETDPSQYIGRMNTAKRRMDRVLRTRCTEQLLNFTGADLPYTLPDDYLESKELIFNDSTQPSVVLRKTHGDVIRLQKTGNSSDTKYYTTTGTQLFMGPNPQTTDSFTLVYYKRPIDFINDFDSNCYTEFYPDILIVGFLAEWYKSIQDVERSLQYKQDFEQLMAEENQQASVEDWGSYSNATVNS